MEYDELLDGRGFVTAIADAAAAASGRGHRDDRRRRCRPIAAAYRAAVAELAPRVRLGGGAPGPCGWSRPRRLVGAARRRRRLRRRRARPRPDRGARSSRCPRRAGRGERRRVRPDTVDDARGEPVEHRGTSSSTPGVGAPTPPPSSATRSGGRGCSLAARCRSSRGSIRRQSTAIALRGPWWGRRERHPHGRRRGGRRARRHRSRGALGSRCAWTPHRRCARWHSTTRTGGGAGRFGASRPSASLCDGSGARCARASLSRPTWRTSRETTDLYPGG